MRSAQAAERKKGTHALTQREEKRDWNKGKKELHSEKQREYFLLILQDLMLHAVEDPYRSFGLQAFETV